MQFELLIESGDPDFEFFDQPAGKALGLGNGQLAKFRTGAGDRAAPERRGIHDQARGVQTVRERESVCFGYVDDNQVLHIGGAQVAVSETVGEVGGGAELLGGDASAQNGCTHGVQSGLALWLYTGMIAINIRGLNLGRGRLKLEPKAGVQFGEK